MEENIALNININDIKDDLEAIKNEHIKKIENGRKAYEGLVILILLALQVTSAWGLY